MGDVVPFGRNPRERADNAARAQSRADHPAGRRRGPVTPAPQWASQRRRSPEEQRAAVLAAKPSCRECGRMFHPRGYVPADLVCMSCRTARLVSEVSTDVPAEPGLFDPPTEKREPHD